MTFMISIPSAVTPGEFLAYAYNETNAANNFLLKLGSLAGNLTPPTINAEFPASPSAPPLTVPAPPAGATIVWTAPALPTAFSGSVTVDDILPAPFEDDPPELVFGSVPIFNEIAPDAPGVDISFDIPDLVVNLPVAPSLLSINVSPFDGINIPTLDVTIPELTIDAPSIREYTPGAQYTSGLLTRLKTKLEDILTNGGTGLSPDVEQAIWDRGREREARQMRDSLNQLDRDMEQQGFSVPPGFYLDARLKIQTEADANNRGTSREIMIKQAELEQSNVNHALDASIQIEGQLISYTNQVEQRFFDSCKYATEAGVSIYNARVQAYAAFVDAFKARIAVYEATIRGELAKVDAYKAQMEAEQTKAEVNRALVDQYKVQIEASLSAVEIFKARVGAIQAKAEIEKAKIEIYGEQVKAYSARVNAYTAGVEGFRATIEAEGTKQTAFKAKVETYSARVQAATALIDGRIKAFEAQVAAKGSEYDAFKAAVAGESARVQSIATANGALFDGYKATVSGIASYNDVLTKQWAATVEQASRVAEIGVATAKANAELYVTVRQAGIEAAKVGATVSAQLGAAALNAINFSNSVSASISSSSSSSESESTVESTSESQSTNYNYNL
jgi:hypothetical protein